MTELEIARKKISEIDAQMAVLFEERMKACTSVAHYKMEHGLAVRDLGRENQMLEKYRGLIANKELEEFYIQFVKNTINVSCDYQERLMQGLRVAYCGVAGAFGYMASKRMFPEAKLLSFPGFRDAYEAVENGEADVAVLPMENSYAGEVGAVMDLMFFGSLSVNQVLDLAVEQHLLVKEGTTLRDIKKVISHPQALSQCEHFLTNNGFETEGASNTAFAAKMVSESEDKSIAAIGSEEAAQAFGLSILARDIQDSKNNTTRFGAFSRVAKPSVKADKRFEENFMLVFTVRNQAGSLAQALNIIGAHDFNMKALRSRPVKDLNWNYYFYVEAEGDVNTQDGKDMLRELSVICDKVRLIGSYHMDH